MLKLEYSNATFCELPIPLTRDELLSMAMVLAAKLPAEDEVCVFENCPVKFAIIILAFNFANKVPILSSDESGSLKFDSIWTNGIVELKASSTGLQTSGINLNAKVIFRTSGSTGVPVNVAKSWAILCEEALMLSKLFGFDSMQRVLTLVPSRHLYGFLFSFLVTLLNRAVVASVEPSDIWETRELLEKADAVIAVPASWPLVRDSRALNLFFSGASFGTQREQEFLSSNSSQNLFEIFGSTETGGIGYRKIGASEPGVFTAFPGVELYQQDSKCMLKSPFLLESGAHELQDDIIVRGASEFQHLGRKDRVFKHSGKRYSLTEIEEALKSLVPGTAVKCFFIEDTAANKGGDLVAFFETDSLDVNSLMRRWRSQVSLPFPNKVHKVPAFPNVMGKLGFANLLSASIP